MKPLLAHLLHHQYFLETLDSFQDSTSSPSDSPAAGSVDPPGPSSGGDPYPKLLGMLYVALMKEVSRLNPRSTSSSSASAITSSDNSIQPGPSPPAHTSPSAPQISPASSLRSQLRPLLHLAHATESYGDLDTARQHHTQRILLCQQAPTTPKDVFAQTWFEFGAFHCRTGDLGRAEVCLRHALRAEPAHPLALFLLAGVLCELDRPQDARHNVFSAVTHNPSQHPLAPLLLMLYHEIAEEDAEAEDACVQTLDYFQTYCKHYASSHPGQHQASQQQQGAPARHADPALTQLLSLLDRAASLPLHEVGLAIPESLQNRGPHLALLRLYGARVFNSLSLTHLAERLLAPLLHAHSLPCSPSLLPLLYQVCIVPSPPGGLHSMLLPLFVEILK